MTDEAPYECDTSKYYYPYKVNNRCVCNLNLVEIDGQCLCNTRLGFQLYQQNDNCECKNEGKFLYLSATKLRCVPCDELHGQILVNGKCTCADGYKQSQYPLSCNKCAENQILLNNTCICKATNVEGTCNNKTHMNLAQVSLIVLLVFVLFFIVLILRDKIKKLIQIDKNYKKQQAKQQTVQVQKIRRSQLIICNKIV
ncbi:Hypothetical_protein [Hexamita inflata]|uniref:Hypothetical_protein n=1 Tax=Hexamita inflata TaxID=28002 RepID=A0AA86TRX2_9EUKA|nr:Hypothetical protein HINF_LOCUS13695 [Hexamita inflata]